MTETRDITLEESLEIIRKKDDENGELRFQLAKSENELVWLKRQLFGQKSERFIPTDNGQLSFDLEGETEAEPEPKTEKITYERQKPSSKKKRPVRVVIPASLPRQEEIIEPENIPAGAKKIGEEVTEIIEMVEAKFYVRKIIRPKYGLPRDEGVIIGQLPSLPIPKGNAGASLLAQILISKFTDHLPFYRQRKIFKRQGLEISESTIGGWFTATCRLLEPLYHCLRTKVLEAGNLQVDETPIRVLTSAKPGSTHKGYHWVYHSPSDRLVLFDYRKGRSREGPEQMLKNFQGTLQTDGYAGYNGFEKQPGITLLACMAHARRKFIEARDNDPERAGQALSLIGRLYETERQARENQWGYDERKTLRKEKATPVLKELESWLKTELQQVLPKSAIGQAMQYTLRLWHRLEQYTENGMWEIDNNLIENTIRPVALGRKNYLFAGSHEAAQRAAMIYSLLGTCKLNDVEPFSWLRDALTRLPDHPVNRLNELLPPNGVSVDKMEV